MLDHLDIFNDIFSIQDKLTDNDFLELNNYIKFLIDENNELRINNYYYNDINYYYDINILKNKLTDNEFINLNNKINIIISENNSLLANNNFYDYYNNYVSYEDNIIIFEHTNLLCRCCDSWIYPNINNINYINYFCLNSKEELIKCKNFNKLLKDFPLLKNLFEKQDIQFTENIINKNYDKKYIIMIIKIFLSFIEYFNDKKDKIIIFFVMYDFLLKNIRFIIDNEIFKIAVFNKLNECIEDREFILYTNEYNINYNKWLEIIKNI